MPKSAKTFKVCMPASRDNLQRVRGWLKSIDRDSTYLKEKTWVSETYFTLGLCNGVVITGSDSVYQSPHFVNTFANGTATPILSASDFFSLKAGEYPKLCEECGKPSLLEPYGHQRDGLIYACPQCTQKFEYDHKRFGDWNEQPFDVKNPYLLEAQRLLTGLYLLKAGIAEHHPVSDSVLEAGQDKDTINSVAEALYAFKSSLATTLRETSKQAVNTANQRKA